MKTKIPDKPLPPLPWCTKTVQLGQATTQVKELDKTATKDVDVFDKKARLKWRNLEEKGITSVHAERQQRDAPAIDETLIGTRIEYLSYIDMNNEGDQAGTPLVW